MTPQSQPHPQPSGHAHSPVPPPPADQTVLDQLPAGFSRMARLSRGQLETALLRGTTPDVDQLVGWEFRGLNLPAWLVRPAGIRKFIKGFERRSPPDGAPGPDLVFGYNRVAVQNRADQPWQAALKRGASRRFGWYRVAPVDATARDNQYLHALLFDYGRGGNRAFDPSRGLRDYLVQVDPDDPDLYLGKAYYALGPTRVPATFFLLARWRPTPPPADRD